MPAPVMVFTAISGRVGCDLKFEDPCVKVSQHYYWEEFLRDTVLTYVRDKPYLTQQGGAKISIGEPLEDCYTSCLAKP